MSYRHSSYRKVKKAFLSQEPSGLWKSGARERIAHWTGLPRPPKGPDWGVSKRKRRAA